MMNETRTVLITGAAGGIGRACTVHFAAQGWRVFGVDRTAFGTDGTFSDYFQGRLRRTGTYEQRTNGQLCFTYDSGATTECWTMDGPPNEDGWANSTRISDGLTIRARPIAEQD